MKGLIITFPSSNTLNVNPNDTFFTVKFHVVVPVEYKESCSFILVIPHSAVAGIEIFRTAKLDV